MQQSSRGRVAAVLSLTIVALFAMTAVASASTITLVDGTLVYRGDLDEAQTVNFNSADADTVTFTTDDPVEGAVPAGCTDTSGGAGTAFTCDGVARVDVQTSNESDEIYAFGLGDQHEAVLNGLAGGDSIFGGEGDDTVIGGPGRDDIRGGLGNDFVSGGDGDDVRVVGGPGNDTVNGDAGDDVNVYGGPGSDVVNGGDGQDVVSGGCFGTCTMNDPDPGDAQFNDGPDTVTGGAGIDVLEVVSGFYNADPAVNDSVDADVFVTLDGVANDGFAGENDNYAADIENLTVFSGDNDDDPTTGEVNATGTAGMNNIQTGQDNDTINPAEGNDFVFSSAGNDTISAVDGFADYIDCGEDNDSLNDDADVANVDEFDDVANCETVNVTRQGRLATEDQEPTVSWTIPASDGLTLPTTSPTRLAVNAADDKGIAQVIFLAGNRVLCNDTVAPYECDYTPTGDDVGETTLVAIAIDTAQQTTVALRFVELNRFALNGFTFRVSPKSDQSYPLRFRARGRLVLPTGVSAAEGCTGRVVTRWKVGTKTISTRGARVKDDCTWSVRNKFGERYRIVSNTIRVFARFQGNDVLRSKKGKTRRVSVLKGGDGG